MEEEDEDEEGVVVVVVEVASLANNTEKKGDITYRLERRLLMIVWRIVEKEP